MPDRVATPTVTTITVCPVTAIHTPVGVPAITIRATSTGRITVTRTRAHTITARRTTTPRLTHTPVRTHTVTATRPSTTMATGITIITCPHTGELCRCASCSHSA